jgi:hypothetical protein
VEHGGTQPTIWMDQRFREALDRVMTNRLNLPYLQPLVLFADTREAMSR